MRLAAALLGAALIMGAAAGAWAAPAEPSAPRVVLRRIEGLTTTQGTLGAEVSVALPRQISGMTVRLRLLAADGTTVYQSTQTRGRLDPGAYQFSFQRDLSSVRMKEGVWTLEARVRATGSAAVVVSEPLYVVGPDREPLPVAIVVRFAALPMSDPMGRFVIDPAQEPSIRSEIDALARLSALRPDLHLTAALPPIVLDELRQVADGYSLDQTGTAPVTQDAAPCAAAASTLASLRQTLRSDALTLVGVGYADPACDGLEAIGAIDDLALQLSLGATVTSETLGAVTTAGAAVHGDALPRAALAALAARQTTFVLLAPGSVRSVSKNKESSASPGAYAIVDSTATALVFDPVASGLFAGPAGDGRAALGHLFARLTTRPSRSAPVVAVVDVGPGSRTSVNDLQALLAVLARTGWVTLVDAPEAASMVTSGTTVVLPASTASVTIAPYWSAVATARERVMALQEAVGPADADAETAVRALLVAESAAWSIDTSGAVERGAAFSAAADERAWSVLSKATLAVPNVTLSGNAGRVPVSINNATDRPMLLTLRMRPKGLHLKRGSEITFLALPGENIQSVAVEMGTSLSGAVHFDLAAGRLTVASGDATVRASYIDRLAILLGVIVVLVALLWYITRRGPDALDRLRKAADTR
ncbi:MAG: hypothetical protein Q7W16_07675 [Coriobacteriia bacterium]|nr:hypothetical protein [Coriobacteriia bacterium]